MRTGEAAARAALACVGARFRPQGRDPDYGLDCVGVAAMAYGLDAPCDYALRGGDPAKVAARIAAAGLERLRAKEARPGDLLLIEAGPAQLHLGVWTGRSLVQAHAGLRRVVETPGWPDAPVLAVFRSKEAF